MPRAPRGSRVDCWQRRDKPVLVADLLLFATSLDLFKVGFKFSLFDPNLPGRHMVAGKTKLR